MSPTLFTLQFVNIYTRRLLAELSLSDIPQAGDWIYFQSLGYEVVCREWQLVPDQAPTIAVLLRPHLDEEGEQPFTYPQEEEGLLLEGHQHRTISPDHRGLRGAVTAD